jgi:penicillin-binding protein 2
MRTQLLPFQGWRLTFFQGIMFAIFALFSLRMYQLQIIDGAASRQAADDNRLNELPIPAPRGVIFDRNNQPLAINVPAFNVTVIPAGLPESQTAVFDIYNRLSALIDVPPTNEAASLAGANIRSIESLVDEGARIAPYVPVTIAVDVDRRVAMQILEERTTMPGVDINPVAVREYPTGSATSHIIGYMGPIGPDEAEALREQGYDPAYDRIGYDGIELFLEDTLGGQRGRLLREVDVAGLPIGSPLEQVDPIPGQNIRLTIDTELQQAAEIALRDRIALVNANAGQIVTQQGVVIAMNPQTGEILAMVSYPGYDNSRFARAIDVDYYLDVVEDPLRPLINNAIRSLYPPGSVWKLITALGVVQEGVIDPSTQLTDQGSLVLENRYAPNDPAASQTFVCWLPQGHGRVNLTQGIAYSCDVYFYQIGGGNPDVSTALLREGGLGITDLFRWSTAMGIGSELGVELPAENPGRMPDPDWKRRNYGENWSTGDTYNAAFGQGYVTVTPLQLISAVAAIANGGTLYQPTVIREFLDAEGNVTQPFEPQVSRTVNIDNIAPDEPLTLLLLEDMIMKGPNSLACACEDRPDNDLYNPNRCNPESYTNTVDIDPDPFLVNERLYTVHIPLNYVFNGNVCQPLRFDSDYRPPFASTQNVQLIQQGMRDAVTVEGGTARVAQTNLPYVNIAGKTGTAEYCDDVARPLGLCVPGNWPAHAWFVSYAPYENPEILVLAFVYNGDEGSAVALPIAVEVMDAYFRLQNERGEVNTTGLTTSPAQDTSATPVPLISQTLVPVEQPTSQSAP